MDWFKWLSSSNLDPSSVHKYGVVFTQNQLQDDDIPFFNHEFLHSMGITVAKHRLEILKLVKPSPSKSSSKVLVVAKKTKHSFAKYMMKAFTHKHHDRGQKQSQNDELVIIHMNDESTSKVEYDHQDSNLNKGLTILKRNTLKKNQSASATTTPENHYTYKKQYGDNGTSPIHGNVKKHRRVVSFATTTRPFEEGGSLKMADAGDRHDKVHGGFVDDFDLDDGYWSAGVEETKWDNLYHNLKPN